MISSASNLSNLLFKDDPEQMVGLRDALRGSGNVQAEREVNEAFHRHDPNKPPSLLVVSSPQGRQDVNPPWVESIESWGDKAGFWYGEMAYWAGEAITWLQQVAFDWTCGCFARRFTGLGCNFSRGVLACSWWRRGIAFAPASRASG
jgi:hypothetical protein